MKADAITLIVGAIVSLSSLMSLKLGLSLAIAKIVMDAAGNLGLKPEERMTYMAGFGVTLAFLAGTEIDTRLSSKTIPQTGRTG
jgi:hypothetical protein